MRLAALALLLPLPLAALAASDPLPPDIASRMAQDKKDCGAPVTLEKGFITRKDVNGDGIDDYILNYGSFVCGDFHSLFCGSGGCTTAIYASRNGQFANVFDGLVQGMTFKTVKGRPAVLLGLHGSACGKMGAAPCSKTLYWNGSTFGAAH